MLISRDLFHACRWKQVRTPQTLRSPHRTQTPVRTYAAKHGSKDTVKRSRRAQLQATELLAKLLESGDPAAVAQHHIDSLTEEFFMVSSTYMEMARKEADLSVFEKLETVLKIAMKEKQKTLRPEIQLLNNLLGSDTAEARQQVLMTPDARDVLRMDDDYFDKLLDRMTLDVSSQPDTPSKMKLMEKLRGIKADVVSLR